MTVEDGERGGSSEVWWKIVLQTS